MIYPEAQVFIGNYACNPRFTFSCKETFEQRHILVVMENISNFLRIANSLLPVSCLKTS
jgi:hypothetical protein